MVVLSSASASNSTSTPTRVPPNSGGAVIPPSSATSQVTTAQFQPESDGGGEGEEYERMVVCPTGPRPPSLVREALDLTRLAATEQHTSLAGFQQKVSSQYDRYTKAEGELVKSKAWIRSSDNGCACGPVVLRFMWHFPRVAHTYDRRNHTPRQQQHQQEEEGQHGEGCARTTNHSMKSPFEAVKKKLSDGPLVHMFGFYAKLQVPASQLGRQPHSYDEVAECNRTVSFLELLCMLRDFGVVPACLSKHDLMGLWKISQAQRSQEHTMDSTLAEVARSGLDFTQFLQFLVKVALVAFPGRLTPPATLQQQQQQQQQLGTSYTTTTSAPITTMHTHAQSQPPTPPRSARTPSSKPPVPRRATAATKQHRATQHRLLNQGRVDAAVASGCVTALVEFLRLDDPAHVSHVIRTRGKATATRLNAHSPGEQHGEVNKRNLLHEASHMCKQAQALRRSGDHPFAAGPGTLREMQVKSNPLGSSGRGSKSSKSRAAESTSNSKHSQRSGGKLSARGKPPMRKPSVRMRSLDEFERRVFGGGGGDGESRDGCPGQLDSSDDEDEGVEDSEEGSGQRENGDQFNVFASRGTLKSTYKSDSEHTMGMEELQDVIKMAMQRTGASREESRDDPLGLDAGDIQNVQFGTGAVAEQREWMRRYRCLTDRMVSETTAEAEDFASTPLRELRKQMSKIPLSPRGVVSTKTTSLVGVHNHRFSALQKNALALYSNTLVSFLKPFIFVQKSSNLSMKVPALDLGRINRQRVYEIQMQVSNMHPDVITITPRAKGLLADILAITLVRGTASIVPGLTLTMIVEVDASKSKVRSPDVFGFIELMVTATKASHHVDVRDLPKSARLLTTNIPVYFEVEE